MATHPLQALGRAAGAIGVDPRVKQQSSLFQGANDGPAKAAARLTGVQEGGPRVDDAPYFTNNEGIPFPDPTHSKTAGGLPLVSDAFLLQKQQHFNRSKNLERMVHPCMSPKQFFWDTSGEINFSPSCPRWQRRLWIFRDNEGHVIALQRMSSPKSLGW